MSTNKKNLQAVRIRVREIALVLLLIVTLSILAWKHYHYKLAKKLLIEQTTVQLYNKNIIIRSATNNVNSQNSEPSSMSFTLAQ